MNTTQLHVLQNVLTGCIFLFAFFFSAPFASADIAYTVSPLIIDQKAVARDILTREITITNTGSQPITVYPTVNNISLKEGGTIDAFLPPVSSDRTSSLASWIEISRLGLDIMQGESKTVTLTFRIHPEPKPGVYHAFIGFGSGRNRDEAEKQVINGQANGTVVTLTIEDDINEFLKLSRFIVSKFVTSNKNEAAVFTFNNPGDEPVTPKGEIILYDSTGEEVGALPVNAENVVIPPGGEHTFVAPVDIDGKFGKYKAFLSVEYGDKQRATVQDTSFFFVFPLRTMLIVLAVIILIVGLVSWYLHKKYYDEDSTDDSDRLTVHVRDTKSPEMHHDINLKQP